MLSQRKTNYIINKQLGMLKIWADIIKYETMACILVKGALVLGFQTLCLFYHCRANFAKLKLVFHELFLYAYDLKMNANNFLVERFIIQILLVLYL